MSKQKMTKEANMSLDGQFVKINGEWYALVKLDAINEALPPKPLFEITAEVK